MYLILANRMCSQNIFCMNVLFNSFIDTHSHTYIHTHDIIIQLNIRHCSAGRKQKWLHMDHRFLTAHPKTGSYLIFSIIHP